MGRLERISDFADFVFHFDRSWLDDPARPTLGQLFIDRMPRAIATSGLPCWFAHLLPQGPARRLLQRWAALDEDADDDFDLLMAIGGDLPGAVTLHAAKRAPLGAVSYAVEPTRPPEAPAFTLPGAQFKLSVAPGDRGLVLPTRGERGAFIAKFHDPAYPGLQTLEWATTEWARLAGIRCHRARMASVDEFAALPDGLPTGDGTVFLAERFDRSADGPIHVEDFGQILDIPPGARQYRSSYEVIGEAIRLLCPEDIPEYIERLAFMVVCGNGDAHLKNWGVIYPDRRNPRLGPAYDLVAVAARMPRDGLALSLGGQKAFEAISMASFAGLARPLGSSESDVIRIAREARDRALAAWHDHNETLPFLDTERALLGHHFARTPFCREG